MSVGPHAGSEYPPNYYESTGQPVHVSYPIVTQPGQAPMYQPGPVIIMTQPQSIPMTGPAAGANFPASLHILAQTDFVQMKRDLSLIKCCIGWETNARYDILDKDDHRLFYAVEKSDCCSRFQFWGRRGFDIRIFDNANVEVMRIRRHVKACQGVCCACSDCCAHEVVILAPVDEVAAHVQQKHACCKPSYSIMDAFERETLRVDGPCCVFYGIWACCKQKFKVESRTVNSPGEGKITKVWSGILKEMCCCSDAKNFEIDFPNHLDAKGKAGVLGTAILVDFMLWYNRRVCGCAFASLAACV